MANYDFSAPEQRNSHTMPKATMDIYAFAQVIQWLVYGETHKGTHRKKLYKKIPDEKIRMLDKVIDRCLSNDPSERYQNFEEILEELDKIGGRK